MASSSSLGFPQGLNPWSPPPPSPLGDFNPNTARPEERHRKFLERVEASYKQLNENINTLNILTQSEPIASLDLADDQIHPAVFGAGSALGTGAAGEVGRRWFQRVPEEIPDWRGALPDISPGEMLDSRRAASGVGELLDNSLDLQKLRTERLLEIE